MIATGRSSTWIRLGYPILGAETIGRLGSIMHAILDCSIDARREPFSFTSIGDVDRLGLRFREDLFGLVLPSRFRSVVGFGCVVLPRVWDCSKRQVSHVTPFCFPRTEDQDRLAMLLHH